MKRRLRSSTGLVLALYMLTMNAIAAGVVNLNRTGSVSITFAYDGEVVSGGALTLYRVAEIRAGSSGYDFCYVDDYVRCGVDLSEIGSGETARELAAYTFEKKLQGVSQEMDSQGIVTFKDLDLGLYLLVQEKAASGYKPVSPFLIMVPLEKDGEYVYDVDASPKLEPEKEPSLPDDPFVPVLAPDEPEIPPVEPEPPGMLPVEPETMLPQSGMTSWPIPVLAVGGVFLLVLGWYLKTTGGRDEES